MAATSPTTAATKYSTTPEAGEMLWNDRSSPVAVLRVEDLPPFVLFSIKWSPHKYPRVAIVLLVLISLIWLGVGIVQLSASVGVGVAFYFVMVLFMVERLLSSADPKELLQQLLSNSNATIIASKKASNSFYRVLLPCEFIFLVFIWVVALIPFANSPLQLLGGHTFGITIAVNLFSAFCFGCLLACLANTMFTATALRFLWEKRIDTYLSQIRQILLQVVNDGDIDDVESNGKSLSVTVVNEISHVQEEVETWARTIGIPLTCYANTAGPVTFLISIAMCLMIAASRPGTDETRVGTAIFSLFGALFLTFFFIQVLHAVASTNIFWNRLRLKHFNNAKIQQSLVALNWSPERFKDFMENHAINSQVAFGVKITVDRMSKIAGVVGSVIAIVLYFLLREEMRLLTGTTAV